MTWLRTLEREWPSLHFGELQVRSDHEQHVFEAEVYLGRIDPRSLRVELYADGLNGGDPVRQELLRVAPTSGSPERCVYSASVPAARPAADYCPRIMPHYAGAAVPLEAAQILWQR
jgi:starch phosphorylase